MWENAMGAGEPHLWLQAIAIALSAVLVWLVATIIYNLFVHPLRSFPGPLLQRASGIPWAIQHASGTQAFNTQRLHDRYGPVVRIGPGHLSFTDSRAWKDIYGHRVHESNMGDMSKSEIFTHVIREMPSSIINGDREEHQRFRRALSHGFSDSSMRRQEPLIVKYVDLLLKRLTEQLLLLQKSHKSKAHLAVSCRCDWIGAWGIHFIARGTLILMAKKVGTVSLSKIAVFNVLTPTHLSKQSSNRKTM